MTLSGPNAPTLTTNHVALQNLKTPNAAETHPVGITTSGNTATFKLDDSNNAYGEPLANGWYDAYVRHPDLNEAHTTFRFVNADFDFDGGVSINDFNILAANFGKTQVSDGNGGLRPVTFADGDADFDGGVSIVDFNVLSWNSGMYLPDLPAQAGGVAVGNTAAGKLDVVWNADPNEYRHGFKIYRSDDGGVTFNLIHTETDITARSWQDTGPTLPANGDPAHPLTLGQKYWYRVRSYTIQNGANAAVTKAWGIPTNPTPGITQAGAAGIGPGRISLKWTPPAGADVNGYRIYRSTSPNFLPSDETLITATDKRKTRIIDSGLSHGHTYYYSVVTVGLSGSLSMPSLPVSARAQNDGPGISNGGTPFDPATHDSDGDGTVDLQDFDNDNDGTPDLDDNDDDNDGIIDRSEPDDRDTDGDGTADNEEPQGDSDDDGTPDYADPDDDNDSIPDENDPSSGKFDEVPTGPGAHEIFGTHLNGHPKSHWGLGYTPDYVDFSYSYEGEQETTDENGDLITVPAAEPRMNFWGDHLNVTQTYTFSNVPEHSVVSVGGIFGGGDWVTTDPNNPGDGELTITVNGQEIEYETPGGWPQFYIRFQGTIESDSDKIEVSISAKNFDKEDGGSWDLGSLGAFGIGVSTPTYSIEGYASDYVGTDASGDRFQSGSITVSRSHNYKAEDITVKELLNSVSEGDITGIPTTVHFDEEETSLTFPIKRIVDDDSDGGVLVLEVELPDVAVNGGTEFKAEDVVKNVVIPFLAIRGGQIHTQLTSEMTAAGRRYSDPHQINGGKNGLPNEEAKARLMKVAGWAAQGQVEALGDLGFKLLNLPDKMEKALRTLTGLAPAAKNIVKELEFMKSLGKRAKLIEELRQALNAKDANALTTLKEWRVPNGYIVPNTNTVIQPEGFLAYTVTNRGQNPGDAEIVGSVSGWTPNIASANGVYIGTATSQSYVEPVTFEGTIGKDNALELDLNTLFLELK